MDPNGTDTLEANGGERQLSKTSCLALGRKSTNFEPCSPTKELGPKPRGCDGVETSGRNPAT